MRAGWLAEWLSAYDGDSPVVAKVRFPDVSENPDHPAIVAEVRGFDFDYPDVVRRLRDAVEVLSYHNFVD